MNYSQIISRSWEIVKKYRFLFWLGLLAGFTTGGSYNFDTSYFKTNNSSSVSSNNTNEIISYIEKIWQSISHWAQSNISTIIIFAIILVILWLVFLYISYAARAGLIFSVAKIESNDTQNLDFQSIISKGKEFFWRLIGLHFFTALLVMAPIILSVIGIFIVASGDSNRYAVLLILLFLLIIPFIIYIFIISSIALFAERIIILKNFPILQSMKDAWHIVKSKWTSILVLYLIQSGLMMAVGICISIIYGIILGPFIYAWRGDWDKIINVRLDNTLATHIIVILLVSFVISLIVRAFINVFISAYWTISYRALDYLSQQSPPNTIQSIK